MGAVGVVTIADDGTATGSGAALVLFNAIEVAQSALSEMPDPEVPDPEWDDTPAAWRATVTEALIGIRRAWAAEATAHAQALAGRRVRVLATAATDLTAEDDILVVPDTVATPIAPCVVQVTEGLPIGTSFEVWAFALPGSFSLVFGAAENYVPGLPPVGPRITLTKLDATKWGLS